MPRTLKDILADHTVTNEELSSLVARFDTNGDGRLEGDEVRSFAAEVAPLLDSSIDDVIDVLSFYQHDDDPALEPEEVRGFLEVHMTD
jgi:hypothetical protein